MPAKRRRYKGCDHRITPEAIDAFQAKDMRALHRALGLKPWEMSPLLFSENALGTPSEPPMSRNTLFDESYEQAVELRAALISAIDEHSWLREG